MRILTITSPKYILSLDCVHPMNYYKQPFAFITGFPGVLELTATTVMSPISKYIALCGDCKFVGITNKSLISRK